VSGYNESQLQVGKVYGIYGVVFVQPTALIMVASSQSYLYRESTEVQLHSGEIVVVEAR